MATRIGKADVTFTVAPEALALIGAMGLSTSQTARDVIDVINRVVVDQVKNLLPNELPSGTRFELKPKPGFAEGQPAREAFSKLLDERQPVPEHLLPFELAPLAG